MELWRGKPFEEQLSKPTILLQMQGKRALTCKMPIKRQEQGGISNTTKITTSTSGPEVF